MAETSVHSQYAGPVTAERCSVSSQPTWEVALHSCPDPQGVASAHINIYLTLDEARALAAQLTQMCAAIVGGEGD